MPPPPESDCRRKQVVFLSPLFSGSYTKILIIFDRDFGHELSWKKGIFWVLSDGVFNRSGPAYIISHPANTVLPPFQASEFGIITIQKLNGDPASRWMPQDNLMKWVVQITSLIRPLTGWRVRTVQILADRLHGGPQTHEEGRK